MENQLVENNSTKKKKKTDNLILILVAYYLASIPLALVLSGLVYPYLGAISYILVAILSLVFLILTFLVQKLNDTARIILTTITILLLIGSLFFPFVIPTGANPLLSHFDLYYHNMGISDYIFYVLAVDGTFLIFGSYMLWGLNLDKKTVQLFKE